MPARTRNTLSIIHAIHSKEVLDAAAVIVKVHEAMLIMQRLEPPVLEALCDEFQRMAKARTGPRGALKKAWFEYAKQTLEDAQIRERRGVFGLYETLIPPHPNDPAKRR